MLKLIGSSLITLSLVGCVMGEESEPEAITMAELKKAPRLPNNIPFRNATGYSTTFSTRGYIDIGNEFFQDLGTNGRRCVSCHLPSSGWSLTPADMQAIFDATAGGTIDDGFGLGAVFRLNDGANSPHADVSTLAARRAAYSQLLTKGLIRVGMPMPSNAEFELVAVDDPYGYASASELSFFRRPLPSANIRALSTVMWDGRLTFANQSIHFDLVVQANEATTGHAEGAPLTQAQRESLVAFQTELHTAQIWDDATQSLRGEGGGGGTDELVAQPFYLGINDNLGDSQTGAAFTPVVFDLYDAWADSSRAGRRAVERGQALFNSRTFAISGVGGINDNPYFGSPAVVNGTCTTCHNSPNFGHHSIAIPLDIGLVDAARRTPDMPLYTFRHKTTGEHISVVDAGRAMVTGKWADIGRFKGPILRGLAARAPYFHDGSASDLGAAVDFYNQRFGMNLTPGEKSDLVAFLRTL